MAKRYGWTVPEILETDARMFLRLIRVSFEEKRKADAREEWLAYLPWMGLGYFRKYTFDDYYRMTSGANLDLRPADEILKEVDEIRKQTRKKDGSV